MISKATGGATAPKKHHSFAKRLKQLALSSLSMTWGHRRFGWALPRWHGSQRAPVVLSLLAVLSLGAFWAGVPEVIAPAAIVAALTAEKRTLAQKGAIVVATLALLTGVFAALVG